jgi:hypothetical protein
MEKFDLVVVGAGRWSIDFFFSREEAMAQTYFSWCSKRTHDAFVLRLPVLDAKRK